METSYQHKKSSVVFLTGLFTVLFLFSCAEKELNPDDVEYRKDENGTEVLYQLKEKINRLVQGKEHLL